MKVKNDLADIGVIEPNAKVRIEWEIDGDPKDFIHFAPDCGCTANTRVEDNIIIADFTENDAQQLDADKRKSWYPSGQMPVTKGIWAYLKDDKDLYIFDEKTKTNILNPDKARIKLSFAGQVVFEQELAS